MPGGRAASRPVSDPEHDDRTSRTRTGGEQVTRQAVREITNMTDMKQTENVKAKIRVLKLKRETLRELDAGELKQAQGAHHSGYYCVTRRSCTRGPRCG